MVPTHLLAAVEHLGAASKHLGAVAEPALDVEYWAADSRARSMVENANNSGMPQNLYFSI